MNDFGAAASTTMHVAAAALHFGMIESTDSMLVIKRITYSTVLTVVTDEGRPSNTCGLSFFSTGNESLVRGIKKRIAMRIKKDMTVYGASIFMKFHRPQFIFP